MDKLSIVIPFYNEAATLESVVRRALAVRLDVAKQIILVDDGSTDDSPRIAMELARENHATIEYVRMSANCGKGAAVRRGLEQAEGSLIVIQDADLEYDPEDLRQIVEAYETPEVDAVFGSRLLAANPRGAWLNYWGGRAVTGITNLLFGSQLTDQPTCYKSFRREVLKDFELHSDGFELCAELTAKLLRSGHQIHEVPIRYAPRGRSEGKKLRFRHGFRIAWTLLCLRFVR
jgi:glycosyltransferase involved in cell wall biosynthesis